MSILLPCAAES